MAQVDQYAVELGRALALGNVFQRVEQCPDVVCVAGCVTGVTGRTDAGCPAEGINRQARVIRKGRQPGDPGGMACLEDGVLHEGDRWLLRLANPQFTLGYGRQPEWAEQVCEFGDLALVVAGNDQSVGGVSHQSLNSVWVKRMGRSCLAPVGRVVIWKVINSALLYWYSAMK